MEEAVNLEEKLPKFYEHWSPKIVAEYNGNEIMLVKFQGECPFRSNADTDDFFLILEGKMKMEDRNRKIQVGAGELFVVPKGVKHRPVAEKEVEVLLIEPKGEPNSGDSNEREPSLKNWI
ncbi:MAG: cupin domain-containing protein [Rhizobiaceae bacterium]